NTHLANSIFECGILHGCGAISDRSIESPEDLFEGVIVSLAVASGQVRVAPSFVTQQYGVLDYSFVWRIAMADPEFIRLFPVPGCGCLGATYLNQQPVLTSG